MPTGTRAVVMVVGLVAAGAAAGQRKLVVGAGDCKNSELLTGMTEFQKALRGALDGQVIEPEVVLDIVRPRPSRSLEDIKRQVDSARTLFLGGQQDRALELLRQSLNELEKASPELKPWAVTADALALQAILFKGQNKKVEAAESFKRVLRVDPQFALDADTFTPSQVQAFEAVRKDLVRARKYALQVQSAPSGAEVFVDGRSMGKTPLKVELPGGTYRLALLLGEQVSFSRSVELARNEQVQVDLGFEGALSTRAPLCLTSASDKAQQDAALKLAATITADEVVMFRLDSARGDPPYFHAYLWRVSPVDRVRDASVKFDQLGDLARFIATGRPIPASPQTKVEGVEPNPSQGAKAGVADERPPPEPPLSAPPLVAETSSVTPARLLSFGLLGAGAVAAVAGVAVYVNGAGDRAHLQELQRPDGRLQDPADPRHREALDLMPAVADNQTVAFSLLGLGVGALASGAATFLLFPPGAPATVGLVPTREGGALFVQGCF